MKKILAGLGFIVSATVTLFFCAWAASVTTGLLIHLTEYAWGV